MKQLEEELLHHVTCIKTSLESLIRYFSSSYPQTVFSLNPSLISRAICYYHCCYCCCCCFGFSFAWIFLYPNFYESLWHFLVSFIFFVLRFWSVKQAWEHRRWGRGKAVTIFLPYQVLSHWNHCSFPQRRGTSPWGTQSFFQFMFQHPPTHTHFLPVSCWAE